LVRFIVKQFLIFLFLVAGSRPKAEYGYVLIFRQSFQTGLLAPYASTKTRRDRPRKNYCEKLIQTINFLISLLTTRFCVVFLT
jgi:hypothetical protein